MPVTNTKKMAIISFKYVTNHPRVNRLANTFSDESYDVTVIGLDQSLDRKANAKGISFITFPMRGTVQSRFNALVRFPVRVIMGFIACTTLIYCVVFRI